MMMSKKKKRIMGFHCFNKCFFYVGPMRNAPQVKSSSCPPVRTAHRPTSRAAEYLPGHQDLA